ncbi:MAG TPA: ABC transporter substrate-binding protein, partial [Planctomycetota bacterium]|nr:ABC transporter substrate-binding protein [Planctomycetota bacterium]
MEALLKASDFDVSKFPRVELLTGESPKAAAAGTAIAELLEKTLAVTVRVRSMKWPAYFKAVAAGDFQMSLGGWTGDYFDPAAFLEGWTKEGGGGSTGWSEEGFDALMGEASGTADAKGRLGLLAKAEALLLAAAPVVPLHTASDVHLFREGVGGLRPNLLSRFPLKHVRMMK